MNQYVNEAVKITNDLGDVTFVGAVAVFLHTKQSRESQDIDFIISKQITRDKFLNLGYKFITENGKEKIYTPRNYKADIYNSRDLNEISLDRIIKTRKTISINKRGDRVKSICLEGLIVTKIRANRDQDLDDLYLLGTCCYKNIDWKLVKSFSKNDEEFKTIEDAMKFYAKPE